MFCHAVPDVPPPLCLLNDRLRFDVGGDEHRFVNVRARNDDDDDEAAAAAVRPLLLLPLSELVPVHFLLPFVIIV
jgi:hypothetical protein